MPADLRGQNAALASGLQVSDFHFDLPPELIAQRPAAVRSQSRLLHLQLGTGALGHHLFHELPDLLAAKDLLVFNNTRVIPARLRGRKASGGRVEILLERFLAGGAALAQIKASKAPKPGTELLLDAGPRLQVLARQGDFFRLQFPPPGAQALCEQHGQTPLPPYIDRAADAEDASRYQTLYAKQAGAVAAPTAGLHFDDAVFAGLRAKGIARCELTLHVGAGTFQPLRVAALADHRMHREWLQLGQAACQAVNACKQAGGRVVAVGTTAVRSLETAAAAAGIAAPRNPEKTGAVSGRHPETATATGAAAERHPKTAASPLTPYQGETDLFIYPGYDFRVVDALVTNFHLPGSTLLMLVCAFAGLEQTLHTYRIAVQESYRFFSYGDAMLITP